MKVVCAWCGTYLRTIPGDSPSAALRNSHGICEDCAKTLREGLGVPVKQFLSDLGVPVLLVSEDVHVLDVNLAAVSMLGGRRKAILGRRGGEVFECVNSRLPEGCGKTVHCSGCVLRQTVTSTWETGRPHRRIPATLEVNSRDDPGEIAFLVSTDKAGDKVVLRIEAPGENGRNGRHL